MKLMTEAEVIRVLVVEDDEDDYIITRGFFSEIHGNSYRLEWFKSYELGLQAMICNQHDICLVDYRLGAKNGIELLKEALEKGCHAPIIMLTGLGEHQIDLEAMRAGAADYLVKASLQPDSLGRSVRYAIERSRAAAKADFEQASIAALGADVGLALTQRESLGTILYRCAAAMARYLNVHLARIWTLEADGETLQLMASAGAINEIGTRENLLPGISGDQQLLGNGKPILVQRALGDSRVPCQDCVQAEKIAAYAGYPLLLENRRIGLISIFSVAALPPSVIQQLGSIANGISLCIDLKRSEEALDASESKYRAAVENIKEVVFQLDEFGHWTSLNPAWTDITGFEVKDTLGSLFLEYLHHDDRQRNSFIFLQLIERKLDFTRHETRILTKDGKTRWVDIYAQLTLNADGSILGSSGGFTDITERKQAETQIQKLAAFPKVNPNPVLEFDAEGLLTYFNDAALALAKSVGFAHPMAILPPSASDVSRQCLVSNQNRLREDVTISGRTISWSFFPIVASQVVHCYGADITDVLHLEAQFRHAQKLESVGQLAAGVAHDFNNILTVIQGYSDNLLARCDGDAALTGPLNQISDSARRASTLTRQLLMFSRRQAMQTETLDLNALLQNLSNMLTRLLGEDIAVENQYALNLPPIEADPGMIEQVVMNLAVNSRDAMPKGGRLLITTSFLEVGEAHLHKHPDARVGMAVCLTTEDTGCGMDPETMNRIFEPFFSTKEVGRGTGLGLATVYGIVKQHAGWVEVKSQVGTGTTFTIFFPASISVHQPVRKALRAPKAQAAQGQNETILLVEDEPVLREWVKDVLQTNSYQVLEAGSGREALKVWDDQGGKIDLLLTDMVMPDGMTGRDLAKQLRAREPKLKVIYTSGYSSDIAANDPELRGVPFLSKPFPAPQLTELIRSCLDA
ncbi:response regulator [Pedosphaera parvula]|uniref:histidine kinase n=1 Tax=Pedosphaera parvula (strain Ellin514) TaxID=320771 RepID=B9XE83_PEDPL|nr:response regulator [Pedosphaera parvula]EEF61974.1 multi-sensor hybrid histidine kinase [Pedosphaera parvula Ellin514]